MNSHGYSIRFHDLRHSHATILLLEKNCPVKMVSERLGHSSTAFTMDVYVNALSYNQDDISKAMEDILGDNDIIDVEPSKKVDMEPEDVLLPEEVVRNDDTR